MEANPFSRMLEMLLRYVGGPKRLIDVACGEGYVARSFADLCDEVVGVDISSELLEVAKSRTDQPNVSFVMDDAQTLATFESASFDAAVSQMAVMDIPDHRALFGSVRRVLKAGAPFAFSLLHPCFEGPIDRDHDRYLVDDQDVPVGNLVRFYASEGHWHSPSEGVRGSVGSHHRMLSTYINDLVASGFRIERIEELVGDVPGVFSQVPRVMAIFARAI
jgi:ubiquinone/menaquinone biosynthesis C-methylase UbiE